MKKVLLVLVAVLSGFAGQAQKLGDVSGNYTISEVHDDAIYVKGTSTIIRGVGYNLFVYGTTNKDGSFTKGFAIIPIEGGKGESSEVFSLIDGNKNTIKTYTDPYYSGFIVVNKLIFSYVDGDVLVGAKVITFKVVNSLGTSIFSVSLNGLGGALGFVDAFEKKLGGNDPFGDTTNDPFGDDEEEMIDNTFQPYLDSYVKIAASVGVDLSFIYDNPIRIQFGDFTDRNEDKDDGVVIGVAHGSDDDSEVRVLINEEAWVNLDDLTRTTLLFHELSHDILNASHLKGDKNLMNPQTIFKTNLDLINGTIDVFVSYKNGTLQVFSENTLY